MTLSRLSIAVVTLSLWAAPAIAGPCSPQIDLAQARLDKRIDAVAGSGAAGVQSPAAQDHRQPTPGSIAKAEEKLGEGTALEPAMKALEMARMADAANDRAGCEKALAEVDRVLGP